MADATENHWLVQALGSWTVKEHQLLGFASSQRQAQGMRSHLVEEREEGMKDGTGLPFFKYVPGNRTSFVDPPSGRVGSDADSWRLDLQGLWYFTDTAHSRKLSIIDHA